jgi:hypothetical protein
MWPFKSKKKAEDTKPLRDRIDDLERAFRRMEEDWTEVYNKFRTLQMRVAKQVQRLDADSSSEEPQRAESDGANGAALLRSTPRFSSLSPRQQEIQRQILARRQVAKEGGNE